MVAGAFFVRLQELPLHSQEECVLAGGEAAGQLSNTKVFLLHALSKPKVPG